MSLDSLVSSINLMHISPNTNNQKLQEKRFRENKVVQTKIFRNSIQRKLEMHNKLFFFWALWGYYLDDKGFDTVGSSFDMMT